MSSWALDQRRKALEEAFFQKQEVAALSKLREKREREEKCRELGQQAGVRNQELLETMIGMGIEAETLAAFMLVPLIAAAWADERIEEGERDAVLEAAVQSGIQREGRVYELLESWLAHQPSPRLMETWVEYAKAVKDQLDPDQQEQLKASMLRGIERVADEARGLLGIGPRLRRREKPILEQVEAALS